jgi:hypothetical protein
LASADDAPPPPPGPRLERLFAPLKEELVGLPPFLRDTDLSAHFRIYYFNQLKPDDTRLEALAAGGWIKYQSGWLLDTFAMGASFFGSAPLYAPADTDGTLLLKTGQKGYYVPGEHGALRYRDYIQVGLPSAGDRTATNPQDNHDAEHPEGVTLGGTLAGPYLAGYLWNIKQRNPTTRRHVLGRG